jgi:hypothetical protein
MGSRRNTIGCRIWIQLTDRSPLMQNASLTPSQLPVIDAVDVIRLTGFGHEFITAMLDKQVNQADPPEFKPVDGELAQQIASLFRQLPPGEPARCHTPPFGLRFYMNGKTQGECSICWDCNNIYGDFRYDFHAGHPTSEALFSLLTQISNLEDTLL